MHFVQDLGTAQSSVQSDVDFFVTFVSRSEISETRLLCLPFLMLLVALTDTEPLIREHAAWAIAQIEERIANAA